MRVRIRVTIDEGRDVPAVPGSTSQAGTGEGRAPTPPELEGGAPKRGREVEVPVFLQDPATLRLRAGGAATEEVAVSADVFSSGPACEYLEVEPPEGTAPVPFDGRAGRFRPAGAEVGVTPERVCLHTFGTAAQVVALFEDTHVLGRRVRWAFSDPRLRIVPDGGEGANAAYRRSTGSVGFGRFAVDGEAEPAWTAVSQDVVAHEVAHAVVDGLLPDLYDALDPESLALHESLADLVAVVVCLQSPAVVGLLSGKVAAANGWDRPLVFVQAIAEQVARRGGQAEGALRSLDQVVGLPGTPGVATVADQRPHTLSVVLSGALYGMFRWLLGGAVPTSPTDAAAALRRAARQFARFVFRALPHLPPGEVGFRDFARAALASDRVFHPGHHAESTRLLSLLAVRGVSVEPDLPDLPSLLPLDLDRFRRDDRHARARIDADRRGFGVPEGVAFEVRRRELLSRAVIRPEGTGWVRERIDELLTRIVWEVEEPVGVPGAPAATRAVTVGTVLSLDARTGATLLRLTGNALDPARRQARDAHLGLLLAEGSDALVVRDGVLRARATGATLHFAPGERH